MTKITTTKNNIMTKTILEILEIYVINHVGALPTAPMIPMGTNPL